MPKVIRTRTAPSAPWPMWVAGAALGAVASWLLWRPREEHAHAAPGRARAAGTRELLAAARARVRAAAPAPDLAAIAERLHARPGTEALRVRSLGGGILEIVGSAPDDLDLRAVLDRLAEEPGVTVVVNRAWISRSGAQ